MREDDEVAPGSGTTREERRRDPSRVLALTDGVFAALLGRYYEDPLALRLFGLILMGTSVARTVIWAYAAHKPSLVHEPLDRASFWSGLALSVFPVVVYVVAFAIARVSPQASLAVYASAPVLYFIAITLLRWLAPRGSAERQFT